MIITTNILALIGLLYIAFKFSKFLLNLVFKKYFYESYCKIQTLKKVYNNDLINILNEIKNSK